MQVGIDTGTIASVQTGCNELSFSGSPYEQSMDDMEMAESRRTEASWPTTKRVGKGEERYKERWCSASSTIIRWWILLVIGWATIPELHLHGPGAEHTSKVCWKRQGACSRSIGTIAGGHGRTRGDQGEAEAPQPIEEGANTHIQKRATLERQRSDGRISHRNEAASRTGEDTTQTGVGGYPARNSGVAGTNAKDQGRQGGRNRRTVHEHRRDPRRARPREGATSTTTGQIGERKAADATPATTATRSDDGVHGELQPTGERGITKYASTHAYGFHTGTRGESSTDAPSQVGGGDSNEEEERCLATFRSCRQDSKAITCENIALRQDREAYGERADARRSFGGHGEPREPGPLDGSIEEFFLHHRLQQRRNDRPDWLVHIALLWTMLATFWFGLVLSPKRWFHHDPGGVQDLDETQQRGNQVICNERKVRNHTIGRWTLTRPLILLFFLSTWTRCYASEDEQTRQWLRQRRLAMTLQTTPAAGLAQRWQSMEDSHGLRRPPPRGFYDAAIARPQDDLRQMGHSYGLRIHYAAEPHGLETLIVNFWADIRRDVSPHNQWRLHPMHGAAYTSSYFPTTHRHYLITTDWERHCRPRKRAIAVEIKWHHARATEHALARPWMRDDEATVSFLEEMHLLQACTSTHRCHIHHHGVPTESRWMKFSHGDYVMVEAFKLEPPHDTDSEGELPMPIPGIVSDDTSSWTSSYTTQESIDEPHLADTYMSDALIIYRPLGRTLRPPYLIQAMHTTNINNLVIVMQHWQDLRYHPWRIECVHPTYNADYPQSDETHIYVVVALCDLQSPLHQVVLNVVQTLDTTLQRALPLPPHVERDDILQANSLQDFCQRPQHTCRVYKNGQLLTEGDRRIVTHGDYIRTTITNVLDEETERRMADSFQVSAQAAGLEHLDETGLAMLDNGRNGQPNIVDNRPRPSQASSSRGPSEQLTEANAGNAMNHDRADYWIFNASIMYVAAMILGRQIYQPEVKGKIKRKQRRLDKTPSNGKILRTLAFAYLVVGAEALAIQVREGRLPAERQFDDLEPPLRQLWTYSTMSSNYLVCREPLEGLPPPGNPQIEEDIDSLLSTPMIESLLSRPRTETRDFSMHGGELRQDLNMWQQHSSQRLSPPGNPVDDLHLPVEGVIDRTNLTEKGLFLIDFIGLQATLKHTIDYYKPQRKLNGHLVEQMDERKCTVQSTCMMPGPQATSFASTVQTIGSSPGTVPRVYLPIDTSDPNSRDIPGGG